MKKCLRGLAGLMCLAVMLYAGQASAQTDLSGAWAPYDSPNFLHQAIGPFPMDFTGIPLNQEGRAAAAAASADEREELQRQCAPWLPWYTVEGPFGVQFRPITDPISGYVVAWYIAGILDRMPMTIWMDHRAPPPPLALHTYGGFTTGEWRGDTLVTTTTHLNDGTLTRNGAPSSNQATFTMFITRHENLLTITGVVHDPVYLDGPYIRPRTFKLNPAANQNEVFVRCSPAEIVEGISDGYHSATHLPGKNPALLYMQRNYNIPLEAAQGGAQTIYPDYRNKLKSQYTIPAKYCAHNCCASPGIRGTVCPVPATP